MKQITLTFINWSYGNLEMLMSIEKDGKCIHEHTILFDKLPMNSQLRFLAWAMNNSWDYKFDQLPGNWDYDEFHVFTLAKDGKHAEGLRYFLDDVANGGKQARIARGTM